MAEESSTAAISFGIWRKEDGACILSALRMNPFTSAA